jgi:hypothetical protein
MQTKYIVIVVAVMAALVLMSLLRPRSTNSPLVEAPQSVSFAELSEGEQNIVHLVREVYGDAIVSETFVRIDGSAKVDLRFDTNKTTRVSGTNTTTIKTLSINLSSLARKQKDEGLTDGAVKDAVKF